MAGLNEAQVRRIKELGIAKAHPTAVGRAFGISTESVRRIWRGETHAKVRVTGEEVLWPQGMGTILPMRQEAHGALGLPMPTDEEIAESEARLLASLRKPEGDVLLGEMMAPQRVEDEVERKAREMLGL